MRSSHSPRPGVGRRPVVARGLILAFGFFGSIARAEIEPDGAAIYRDRCASCHGAKGEGVAEEFPRALEGDRTVPQLARLIARTMPSDDPGTCVGPDADAVATYIYGAFYSKESRSRREPAARIELTRLTVRQYRNSVADLIETFRGGPGRWGDRRGLEGDYSKTKRHRDEDRAFTRLDPRVRFDFGKDSPEPGKIEPLEFAIRWKGAVLAPETGEYEFVVRTENGARLFLNDNQRPLIDASVKSGNDTEYRGSIRLLGGRAYPIRLEYTKAKIGVEDSKEKKAKLEVGPGSIALEWKPPGRALEVIPDRFLSPARFPETFVVAAAFPPDDRSVGFERGTSISKAWDSATTDAAIEVATYVGDRLRELAGTGDDAPERAKKLRDFGVRFAERAFRRPLTPEQKTFFVGRVFDTTPDPKLALQRVILLVLKSPRFLYRELGDGLDAYDVASRVSFGLWDSLPDKDLLDAAAHGKLSSRDDVAIQARRMVADLRARGKLRDFLFQWLKVESAPDIAKDPKLFPGFDPLVVSDLRASLELAVADVVSGPDSDFRQLLVEPEVYLNGRLSRFYGVATDAKDDASFQKVALDPGERAGVLSHPYLLACFAYTATSSPIHRGVFLSRSVLGRGLRPPPEAVAPLAPELHAGLSTRERVALQTSPAACMTCHSTINPLGFGLERFDAVGRFRRDEKGKAVDASGSYEGPSGSSEPFVGASELAGLLASSEETHAAFVRQLFHDVVKQPIAAFGPDTPGDLRRAFAKAEFGVRDLMVEIVATSALAPRSGPVSHSPSSSPRPVGD